MIFFLFHIEIEGKCGWIIGGAKGYVGPPLKLLGGPGPPGPPSSYAYAFHNKKYGLMGPPCHFMFVFLILRFSVALYFKTEQGGRDYINL